MLKILLLILIKIKYEKVFQQNLTYKWNTKLRKKQKKFLEGLVINWILKAMICFSKNS